MFELPTPGPGTRDALFWSLLTLVTGALIAPFVVTDIPAQQDFGGHLALVDLWARFEDVEAFASLYERRDDISPNLLPARICGWLAPWASPLQTLRALAVASQLGLVAAMVYALRVFDRSRWLIFIALPVACWNGIVTLGMLNNMMAMPFMFWGVALARRCAQTDDWRRGVALALALVMAHLCHGIMFVFAFGMCAGMLALSLRGRRQAVFLLALLPGLALWSTWLLGTRGRDDMPGLDFGGAMRQDAEFHSPGEILNAVSIQSVEVLVEVHRGIFFALIVAALFALWLWCTSPRVGARALLEGLRAARASSRSEGLGAACGVLWRMAAGRPVLCMAAAMTLALFCLPTAMMNVPLGVRLIAPTMLAWTLAVSVRPGNRRAWIVAAVIAVASLYWSSVAWRVMSQYQEDDLEPMQRLMAEVPRGASADCIIPRDLATPIYRNPLIHGCYGLLQRRRDAIVGVRFAWTDFNAMRLRLDASPPGLEDPQWSYLLVRGDARVEGEPLATAKGPRADSPRWRLLRVARFSTWLPPSRR